MPGFNFPELMMTHWKQKNTQPASDSDAGWRWIFLVLPLEKLTGS